MHIDDLAAGRLSQFVDPLVAFCLGLHSYVKDHQSSAFALGFLMPPRPIHLNRKHPALSLSTANLRPSTSLYPSSETISCKPCA